jgi:hypothetical protein
MRHGNIFSIFVIILLSSATCTTPIKNNLEWEAKGNLIYEHLASIDYLSYEGKTIGYFLETEKITYQKYYFIDEPHQCLNYVEFVLGHGVYLDIYCPQNPQYIRKCDATVSIPWKYEDFIKEKTTEIVLIKKNSDYKKAIVFRRK